MAQRSYTTKTIKVLFGSSGNQCAHPECTNPVVVPGTELSDEAVSAQICHIYAASDNGPRGKPDLTDLVPLHRGYDSLAGLQDRQAVVVNEQ
ncbi:hypothetical protein V4D00_23730, partial [Ralstonia solanacearum]|uniref:hypothetical protein n=1 Tax=Ralstonia solanacearum TaxID=305 RepID=UPI002F94EF8C